MIIAAHHSMMQVSRLPYDTEVEYLETDGSAYIDTGIVASSRLGIIGYMSLPATGNPFGALLRSEPLVRYHLNINAYQYSVLLGVGTNYVASAASTLDNTMHRIEVDTVNRSTRVDAGPWYSWSGLAGFDTGLNAYLPARNDNGTAVTAYACRVGAWSFRLDGSLVSSIRPVRIGSEGCFYDIITGRVIRSAVAGTAFVPGPDK